VGGGSDSEPHASDLMAAATVAGAARPLIVELAGPAGGGKSSLLDVCGRRDRSLRTDLRVARSWHVATVSSLLPTFIDLHRPFRGILWKEMKRILHLQALHAFLRQPAFAASRALVLDEGPVYMLARILVLGESKIQTRGFARWWRAAIATWARALDVVVWLDAPTNVLAGRIRHRPQPHPVRELSEEAIGGFLEAWRVAYIQVLSDLAANWGPAVWTFDTHQMSAERLAEHFLARLERATPGCERGRSFNARLLAVHRTG
jgi:hypothetical protein